MLSQEEKEEQRLVEFYDLSALLQVKIGLSTPCPSLLSTGTVYLSDPHVNRLVYVCYCSYNLCNHPGVIHATEWAGNNHVWNCEWDWCHDVGVRRRSTNSKS